MGRRCCRRRPPAAAPVHSPVSHALVGTAVVMPVMLVYLLFGIADALPVLVTTVLLVANFDPRQGATQGLAMMLGNFIGGLIGMVAFHLLADGSVADHSRAPYLPDRGGIRAFASIRAARGRRSR